MSNKDNPGNGARFQKEVLNWFQNQYDVHFELEKAIPIGVSELKKPHKFDIGDDQGRFAIECKRYTWTESGNVPSAKMGFVNEAAFYLMLLPDSVEKYIVMLYSYNEKRGETLAQYYFRTNRHLLGSIRIAEYDPDRNEMNLITD